MNYFLAIGIFSCVVSICSAQSTTTESPCSSDKLNAAAAQCLQAAGLTAQFIRLQTNATTVQDLQDGCNRPELYQQATRCVFNATAACSSDLYSASSLEQSVNDNLALCGDPKVNWECIAEMTRNKSGLVACAQSHWALTNLISRTQQEIMCYGRKLSLQCTTDFLRTCDAYTADFYQEKLTYSTPLVCFFYPDIVG
ncbi:hypothetical protein BsWGS_28361 [Bradybaena similaris]